jgi:hypothetical protein
MDAERFVTALKTQASDESANGLTRNLRQPPGRRPSARSLRLSAWFRQFSPSDQAVITELMGLAAEGAIFGTLCILDGVRVIEDGPEKGEFEVYYIKQGQRTLLNGPDICLHDLYQSLRGPEPL